MTDTQAICAVLAGTIKPLLTMAAVALGWWMGRVSNKPKTEKTNKHDAQH